MRKPAITVKNTKPWKPRENTNNDEKLQKERVNAFKEYHEDAINKKFNDPKITVGIEDNEYEKFLQVAEKI